MTSHRYCERYSAKSRKQISAGGPGDKFTGRSPAV
jgi:hypothetical protein